MPTGIEPLDAILDGGYRRASCVLLAGEPGTGKTTLAGTFVQAACGRGEKVLYINFEESQDAMIGNLLSAGIDLASYVQAGQLQFLTGFPEAMGAEEHYGISISECARILPALVCGRAGTQLGQSAGDPDPPAAGAIEGAL